MGIKKTSVAIVGAGLSGLTLAHELKKAGVATILIEARKRIGGRIHTLYKDQEASLEMGATWLGQKHHHLIGLLEELNLGIKEQPLGNKAFYEPFSINPPQLVDLPPNSDPSYRIKGGSMTLIKALARSLKPDQIFLRQEVKSIELVEEVYHIQTNKNRFTADWVVCTLPPKLVNQTIAFSPALPASFTDIAQQTHTWMGESIKVALTYEKAFWKAPNSSGTIFSNVGPIPEMYDHSDEENSLFALKGFFNGSYHSVSREERQEMVLKQLEKYYPGQVRNFISYQETVWSKEQYTFQNHEEYILPHQNNGDPIFRERYGNGKLLFAGAETASQFPGYMDGAVESALEVSRKIRVTES